MNKAELITVISTQTKISKTAAETCLDAALHIIQKTVASDEDVKLVGFGTFSKIIRQSKPGRNPKTGEAHLIPTTPIPRFKPGKEFKDFIK